MQNKNSANYNNKIILFFLFLCFVFCFVFCLFFTWRVLGPVSERRLSENSEYVNPEMRETQSFPSQSNSTLSSSLNSESVEPPY